MKCRWCNINLGWRWGAIGSMTEEAIEIARLLDTKVSFDFSGVTVNVTKNSSRDGVADEALQALEVGKNAVFGEGW